MRRLLLTALAFLVCAPPAAARPGDLDRSFSGNGWLSFNGPRKFDAAESPSLTADGGVRYFRTAESGSQVFVSMLRLRRGGRPDAGFGGGDGLQELAGVPDTADGNMCSLPDGGFVAPQWTRVPGFASFEQIMVARYGADGSLDASFGGPAGALLPHNTGNLRCARAADGTITVAGVLVIGDPYDHRGLIARFTADGRLDTRFAGDGVLVVRDRAPQQGGMYGAYELAEFTQLAVQPDGKILVAGWDDRGAFVARYDRTGALDAGFGSGGRVSGEYEGLAVLRDGRIVLVTAAGGIGDELTLRMLRPDGRPDRGFGRRGRVQWRSGREPLEWPGGALMVDHRNRIVLTGTPPGGGNAAVLRLRPDGRRDRSFGRNGLARTRLPFLPTDVSEPRGGRIVLAGVWAGGDGRNSTAYVARLRYGT